MPAEGDIPAEGDLPKEESGTHSRIPVPRPSQLRKNNGIHGKHKRTTGLLWKPSCCHVMTSNNSSRVPNPVRDRWTPYITSNKNQGCAWSSEQGHRVPCAWSGGKCPLVWRFGVCVCHHLMRRVASVFALAVVRGVVSAFV
jgi:hypothetical protein